MRASKMRQDMLKITGAAMIAGAVNSSYGRELSDWKCAPQYRWKTDVDINWKDKWKDCEIRPSQQPSKSSAKVKDEELETIFNGLVKTWKEATGGYSVTLRRYAHGSYQSILVLGAREPEVVTLILRELQQRPDWWFEALKVLTKENPVKPGASFEEAVNIWIDWGKKHNNRIP
jgi:hypothetical protein